MQEGGGEKNLTKDQARESTIHSAPCQESRVGLELRVPHVEVLQGLHFLGEAAERINKVVSKMQGREVAKALQAFHLPQLVLSLKPQTEDRTVKRSQRECRA